MAACGVQDITETSKTDKCESYVLCNVYTFGDVIVPMQSDTRYLPLFSEIGNAVTIFDYFFFF